MNDSTPIRTNSPAFEYVYVANQRCDCGSYFAVIKQELRTPYTDPLDVLTARCEGCGAERTFVFDISSFFGDPDKYARFNATDDHFRRAMELLDESQWDEAEAALRQVIEPEEGEPRFAWAHYHLGRVLLQRLRPQEAIACLELAAEIQPLEPLIYEELTRACQAAGQVQVSREHHKRAAELRDRFA
jgi:tetratricopeptide (TPR) repeat protein